MDKRKLLSYASIVLLLAALSAGALVLAGSDGKGEATGKPHTGEVTQPEFEGPAILLVNDEEIMREQAADRRASLIGPHGGGDMPEEKLRRMTLRSLVMDELIEQAADRWDLQVYSATVEARLQEIRSMFQTKTDFSDWLEQQSMDETKLRFRIYRQALGALVYEKVTEDVKVGQADLRQHYRDHRSDFVVDGKVQPFWMVRPQFEDLVRKEATDAAFAHWLRKQRRDARVEILADDWWEKASDDSAFS